MHVRKGYYTDKYVQYKRYTYPAIGDQSRPSGFSFEMPPRAKSCPLEESASSCRSRKASETIWRPSGERSRTVWL